VSAITIRFLGTSAARPIPRWGCSCPQCAPARTHPSARRTRSSILVNDNLLVDSGPDIYEQLRALPFDDLSLIDHIIITHAHADHYLGLDDLASLRRISHLDVLPIYALPDTWDLVWHAFRYLVSSGDSEYDRRPFARHELQLDQPLVLPDGLSVTPLDTRHTQPFVTASLLLEREGRRVLYASDFHELNPKRVAGADLLILDASFLSREQMDERYQPLLEEGQGRHKPIIESLEWAKEAKAARLMFTHFGHLRLSPEQLRRHLPADVELAQDGLVVEV
jgi:phosphoribosyl 1,2-cyclic phosphate phosphodiesterase